MGGAIGTVTMHQLNSLPEVIDREVFDIITRKTFSKGAYDIIADQEGKISRQRMKEVAMQRDVVFSFEWGIDNKGRSCVRRAQKLTDYLVSRGLFVASDDDLNNFMSPNTYGSNKISLRDRVREKMNNTQCMLLIFTQRYYSKFMESSESILRIEFDEFVMKKGARYIIPAIFEEDGMYLPSTPGPFFDLFHHRLCADLSQFESDRNQLDKLYDYILKVIDPLRDGGDFAERNDSFSSSRLGRYYHWLQTQLPGVLAHETAMKYAQILVNEQFDSMLRLMQVISFDETYLPRLGFEGGHATLIAQAVRRDTNDNFDVMKAATIGGIISQQNRDMAAKQAQESGKVERQRETAHSQNEHTLMGVEDMEAYTTRSSHLLTMKQDEFEEKRRQLVREAEQRREELKFQLSLFDEAARALHEREEEKKWHEDILLLLQSTSAEQLGDKFRLLVSQLGGNEIEEGGEGGDEEQYALEYNSNATLVITSKKHKVQGKSTGDLRGSVNGKVFTRSSNIFQHTLPGHSSLSSAPLVKYGDANSKPLAIVCKFPISRDPHELLEVLQQGGCLLWRLEQVSAEQGIAFVQKLLENGVAKTLLLFLSRSYIYQSHFMDVHLPEQALRVVSALCRCQAGEESLHEPLVYLLCKMGAIEMIMGLIKYYIENASVLAEALRSVDCLLTCTNPQTLISNAHTFRDDPACIMLLFISVEKFGTDCPSIAIYSGGILSKLIRSGSCDDLLRSYRLSVVFRRFNEVIQFNCSNAGCDLPKHELLSICKTLEDIYYSPVLAILPLDAYNSESSDEFKEEKTLREKVIIQLDEHAIMPFLVQQLTIHAENVVIAIPVLRTLGNMCFLRHDIKRRLFEGNFPREIIRLIKHFQILLRQGSREDRGSAMKILPEAFCTLSNTIDTIGDGDGQAANPSLTTNNISTKDSKKRSANISYWDKVMQSYLKEGLAEALCEVFDHIQMSETLLHSMLTLLTKMMQRGNTLCTQRFVALGLSDKLALFLDMNPRMSRALYEASCQVLLCLCQSDHLLVNACKRIIEKTRCEHWIVNNMRQLCRAKEIGGHWSHFYSHSLTASIQQNKLLVCRTCAISATLAYQLCCHPDKGEEMTQRLKTAGLHQLLHSRPVENSYGLEPMLSKSMRGVPEFYSKKEGYLYPLFIFDNEDMPLISHRCMECTGNMSPSTFDQSVYELYKLYDVDYGPYSRSQKEFVALANAPM